MKLFRFFLIFPLVAALGACATPMEVSHVTEISSLAGRQGVDVYAAQRERGRTDVPRYRGDQVVEVRTYHATAEDYGESVGEEFAGAQCTLKASNYNAKFQTPAKVRVPLYGAKSSPLDLTCQHPDHRTRNKVFPFYNKTHSDRLAVGANGGLAGVLVVAAVNGLSDSGEDEYRYPILQLPMLLNKPKKKAQTSN